jgi:RNA polymerase sigma-70 factor (ECF subfamily)
MSMRMELDDDRRNDAEDSSRDSLSLDTPVGGRTTPEPTRESAHQRPRRIARGSANELPVERGVADGAEPERPADPADNEMLAALEAGDRGCVMERLVDAHGEDVYRYCRWMVGTVTDADDLSQTVFVQAFQCLEGLPHVRSIRGWLLGIARNRCIDRLRAIRRTPQTVTHNELCAIVDADANERSGGNDPQIRKALDECLDRLDDRSRAVLLLRFCDGLSYNEIATKMSDTAGALRIRFGRALKALRRCLERKGVQS